MLKGTTTIELTDVNTGEKQVITEKNMITNAAYMFANTGGTFTGSPTAGGVYYTSNTIV